MAANELNTRTLERALSDHAKDVARLNDTLKQLNRTFEMLMRHLEKLNAGIAASNELAKHSSSEAR